MECPDPGCREDLLKEIGKKSDSTDVNELKNCLRGKVSVKILCWAIGIVLSTMLGISIISYNAYSRGQEEKQEKLDNCAKVTNQLKTDTQLIQKDVAIIKQQLEKQEKQLERQGRRQEKVIDLLNEMKNKYGRNYENDHN